MVSRRTSPALPRIYQPEFRKQQRQLALQRQQEQENFAQQQEQSRLASAAESQRAILISKYESGDLSFQEFVKLFPGSVPLGGSETPAIRDYIEYLSSRGKDTRKAEEMLPETGRSGSQFTGKGKPVSQKPIEEKFFIEGKPVISTGEFTSSITGKAETAFITISPSGKLESRQQFPASFVQPPVSIKPMDFTPFGLDLAIEKGTSVVGEPDAARFNPFEAPRTEIVSREIPEVLAQRRQEQKFLKSLGPGGRELYTGGKNVLKASQQISEAPFVIGSNLFRGIAETGRGVGRGYFEATRSKPFRDLPFLTISDVKGVPQLQFLPGSQRPDVYTPFIDQKEFELFRERGAIAGGTLVATLPYFAGGGIASVQKFSDLGSALQESPERAAVLFGVGVSSTILLNQLGSVGRLVKGQLGGTIAGSVGYAKGFETISRVGGKALGYGLLAPYVLEEAPPLISAYQRGSVKEFGEGIASIQRVRAPIVFGSQVGQKLSTGFTLFSGTKYAVTSGGLTAPTESLARKRLIANVFDVKPGTITKVGGKEVDVYGIRKLYESQGFTKQKFLESYGRIFSELPSAKISVREYDITKVEAISKLPKAQKALSSYFERSANEFRIYGSSTQAPQLRGVKSRIVGDVDILAKNPEKFLRGARTALIKSGIPKSDLVLSVGTEKSYLSLRGEKFLSVHDLRADKTFFPQLETVGGVIPRRAFTTTPSGIVISRLQFQAGRKVVGGFVDLRAKDIADVRTISKGIEKQLPSYTKLFKVQGSDAFRFDIFSRPKLYADIPAVSGATLTGSYPTPKYNFREGGLARQLGKGKYIPPVSMGKGVPYKAARVGRSPLRPVDFVEPKVIGGEIPPVKVSPGKTLASVSNNIDRGFVKIGQDAGTKIPGIQKRIKFPDSSFRLTKRGVELLEKGLPAKETGLKVKDIFRVGKGSQPIQDISKISGISPKQLARRIRELPVEGFTPFEKIYYGPGVEAKTGPTELGNLGVKIRQSSLVKTNKLFEESIFSHEFEHAGEKLARITTGRPVSAREYYTSLSEQRAFAVQERFLESKGSSLPQNILGKTGLGDRGLQSSLIKRVPSGNDLLASSSRLADAFKTISTSGRRAKFVQDNYPIPTKQSYAPYFPIQKKPAPVVYVPPIRKEYRPVVPTLYRSTLVPSPYIVPPKKGVPYSPYVGRVPSSYRPPSIDTPYSPPISPAQPYTPPATIRPPSYPRVPPKTVPIPFLTKKGFPTKVNLPKEIVSGKRLLPGFFPVLFRAGKPLRRLTTKPLTIKDALAVGASFVDKSIKRSFKLVPSGEFVEEKYFTGPTNILRRGKRDPFLFVERSAFAISTGGEKRALREGRFNASQLLSRKSLRSIL